MAARLKVFVTSDGLTDFVVAATSKPKALAAWGSHQDLFKTGLAHETDDPTLVTAATAAPGEVLRRPARGRGALAAAKPRRAPAPKGPTKAALKAVANLEAKLAALDEEHAQAERALAQQMDDEAAAYRRDRAALEARLTTAKRALG